MERITKENYAGDFYKGYVEDVFWANYEYNEDFRAAVEKLSQKEYEKLISLAVNDFIDDESVWNNADDSIYWTLSHNVDFGDKND